MTPESVIIIGQQALVVTAMLVGAAAARGARGGSRDRHVPGRDADQRDDA